MATDTLHHPTLNCTIRGKPSISTVQFRNLKYATIPRRWQDSVINDELSRDADGVYDATQLGPSCPFDRAAQAWDLTLVGNVVMPMEGGIQEPMDEFSCLQVNVTVPQTHLEKAAQGEQLPVFVWVHGGGLSFGSNNWPQYDLTRFVERSVEIGKPVIGVAINYRVGILGFLASKELGIDGNFGYKDQVVAFQWIKKHIAGFGGDPNRITASGESAGGISLSTLLCVDTGGEALFEKVVIMSGDATLRKSRVRSWHDLMYQDQLKLLGLDQMEVEQRKTQLRELDPMEMVKELPIAQHYCACVDGNFLKENISLDLMADGSRGVHKPTWCKELVIGDTRHDGTILHGRVLTLPKAFENLEASCAQHLTESETTTLFSTYNLPASTREPQHRSLNELISDLRFYLPTLAAHSGWKFAFPTERSSRYHFHVPNPVKGEFTDLASHELDVALLLQNYAEHLDEATNNAGTQMTDKWIKFVCGGPWSEPGKIVVVGARGIVQMDEDQYDREYRGGNGKMLLDLGLYKCFRVAEGWQGVRADIEENATSSRP
ncbi:alpha/beta-hydrolase [Karstenula rhodostoma CBS 690.94]|uniref:Alpha/beta-hydrolase n=1 Tax=Karstenula rhodostoma CBS 690.94 TaxID=1392251 RepID=A0A9P4U8E9_9PLEO|nr:alpha/beta-hydrolase [Karstenula rhodostoma CBS 690.94]